MKGTILNIGDELLIGQTLNTNAQWLSQKMDEIGVDIIHHVSLSDEKNDIINCLENALNTSDVILITGGLGPTSDDITKDVLCEYFGGKLIYNEEAFRNIQNIYKLRQLDITDDARTMSMVPDNCIVIQNPSGTAPGMLFKKENKVIISMPGVPYEMKAMIEKTVIPFLKENFSIPVILHSNILTAGVGETVLSRRLKEFEKNKNARIKLGISSRNGKSAFKVICKR